MVEIGVSLHTSQNVIQVTKKIKGGRWTPSPPYPISGIHIPLAPWMLVYRLEGHEEGSGHENDVRLLNITIYRDVPDY